MCRFEAVHGDGVSAAVEVQCVVFVCTSQYTKWAVVGLLERPLDCIMAYKDMGSRTK